MKILSKKNTTYYLISFFLLIFVLFLYLTINTLKNKNEKDSLAQLISVNLITSVHPSLPWNFKALKSNVEIQAGEVTTIKYLVENIGNEETFGIATFAYFPNQFGKYVNKINCFCYDVQTLKSGEQTTYTLVFFIDPEVTKDSKTKSIKEVTIQFTFFDYKEYQDKKS